MRPRAALALACAVAVSSTVAFASLTLLATGASAFFHPSPNGRCRVTVHVAAPRITAGEADTIFGQLICRRRIDTEGKIVRLDGHLAGVPGFALVQTTTTGAGGAYKFELSGASVEVDSVWHVRSHGAQSIDRRIRVAPEVTFEGPAEGSQILTGVANKVTFSGTVTPASDAGARVILQRQDALTGAEWHRIDAGTVEPGGAYSIPHTFVVPGDANLRVVVLSRGRNAPGFSSVRTYEISQAQNPALTIEAKPDPIDYGQSVTIGGTVAGATGGHPVTLLARTIHQHGFAPVAQAETNSAGAYTFPAQSPVNSTFYEVRTSSCGTAPPPTEACTPAILTSAVLFEGVKFVVSAEASPTSVIQGQVVTFSGRVAPTPVRAGHVIYLERLNASGTGFHIVREAALTPEATFSIPYRVFDVGTDVFRVYIPGGPDNEGAASSPITIKVSPAPAAALKEAPGNTSTPAEGSTTSNERENEGEERGGEEGKRSEPPPHGHGHRHAE
jgi:hypothetical protein